MSRLEPFVLASLDKICNLSSYWKVYQTNLNVIIAGCRKLVIDIEKHHNEIITTCYGEINSETSHKKIQRFFLNILQFLRVAEVEMNKTKTLRNSIGNMRFLQFIFNTFWHPFIIFDLSGVQSVFTAAEITRFGGYRSAIDELGKAKNLTLVLNDIIRHSDEVFRKTSKIYFSVCYDISVLFQRVVAGNIILYTIEARNQKLSTLPIEKTVVDTTLDKESSILKHFKVSGGEYCSEELLYINEAVALLSFYIEDNINSLMALGVESALVILKRMLFDDLKSFQYSGNFLSIVSRQLLSVIFKRINSESYISDVIIDGALQNLEKIDNLTYPEKSHRVSKNPDIIKEKEDSKQSLEFKPKTSAANKKKPKGKLAGKTKNKKTNKYPNSPSNSRPHRKVERFKEESDDELSTENVFDLVNLKSNFVDPTVNYLQIGQFCYQNVLYRLLEELGLDEYTWKQVSEACFTPAGFRALAKLDITQSQVDVCIAIVRTRVPFAHPPNVSAAAVQDGLAILKGQHPEMRHVFDELRQFLATESGWNVVPGYSSKMLLAVPVEPVDVLSAVLQAGEFCWNNIVQPAAEGLGTSIEASTLAEIIELAVTNGIDASSLRACKSMIELRNRYAHMPVSAADAKEAIRIIYGEESNEMVVLSPILSRSLDNDLKVCEFY